MFFHNFHATEKMSTFRIGVRSGGPRGEGGTLMVPAKILWRIHSKKLSRTGL